MFYPKPALLDVLLFVESSDTAHQIFYRGATETSGLLQILPVFLFAI